jgi:hypothetical protein
MRWKREVKTVRVRSMRQNKISETAFDCSVMCLTHKAAKLKSEWTFFSIHERLWNNSTIYALPNDY